MSAISRAISLRTESTHFNITFGNNPKGFYHPNETINGTVELHVEKLIRAAKALKLSVTGEAKCSWKKSRMKPKPVFQGKQVFIDFSTHFFGREDGSHIEVPAGVHLYKFACKIPANAVSSYEGTHGSVRYKITVILDSPAMPDVVFELPLNILRIESLNDFPWLRRGTETELEHEVGIMCCETMPLILVMKAERCGYALGETIKIEIEVKNQGPTKFGHGIISFDRVETYNSQEPKEVTIRKRKVINYHAMRPILEFQTVVYKESLVIPEDMMVSSEKNCAIFQIGYQVKFTIKSSRRTKAELFLPITIAHVPFSGEVLEAKPEYDLQSSPVEESEPVLPIRHLRTVKTAKVYGEIPAV